MIERYEYVDDKSSKFWEFEATTDSLTTRWGRIGAKPQSKTVEATSLEAAIEAGRKVAAKKAKKGYTKVATEAAAPAAAKAPAPVPPEAPPSPVELVPEASPARTTRSAPTDTSRFVPSITEVAWERHDRTSPVHPGWGAGQPNVPPLPPADLSALWDAARKRFGKSELLQEPPSDLLEPYELRGQTYEPDVELTRELWTFYQDDTPDPAKLSSRARRAFLRFGDSYPPYVQARLDLHLALFGARKTFEAVTEVFHWSYIAGRKQLFRAPRGTSSAEEERLVFGLHAMMLPLRHGLAADPDAHAAAMAYADQVWDDIPFLHQPGILLVLNDADRARAWLAQGSDMETMLAPHIHYPSVYVEQAYLPFRILLPPDELPRPAAVGPSFLPAFLHQHGETVFPLLEGCGPVGHRVLSRMADAGTMAIALRSLSERKHTAFLRESFALQPSIGGEAVRIALKDPKARYAALSVAPLTEAAAELAPPGRPATEEELPELLNAPPWTAKKKALKIKPATLPVVEAPVDITYERRNRRANLRSRDAVHGAFDSGWHEVNVPALQHLTPEDWPRVLKMARLVIPSPDLEPLVERFGMDAVLALVAQWTSPKGVARLASFGHVAVVPAIAAGLTKKTARDDARAWVDRFPEQAATGLAPLLFAKTKAQRHQAFLGLFALVEQGHGDVVQTVGQRYADAGAPAVMDAFRAVLAMEPTDLVPPKIPKVPDFVHAIVAPPPRLRDTDAYLDGTAYQAVCTMLAMSTLEEEYPGIQVVRELCTDASLEAFAEGLFEGWLANGGDAKHSWCMLALGWFGGDAAVRRLTSLVRRWPGESAAKRAQLGLDVLARIGTDTALSNVYAISQKLKFKSVQQRASEVVDEIAGQLGLTALELGDRVVPDLDLDGNGTATLDFGPRQFLVRLDEQLRPVLYDGAKVRKSLPKPNQADDAELAKAAKKRLSGLKKDLKTVARQQIQRLERMMCTGRAVPAEVFQRHFVEHPLVVTLVRRLVWRVGSGEDAMLFVVDESGAPVDLDDEPVTLTGDITLPHAIDADLAAVIPAFQERFADYGILQPFEQLARRTYTLEGRTVTDGKVVDFGIAVPAPTWVHGIEREGWERYDIVDGGGFNAHWWEPGGPEAALVQFEGHVAVSFIEAGEEVCNHTLRFAHDGTWVSPDQMSPRFVSETLRCIDRAAGRE
jgi:predicted DNA-binding WGR domain protein